MENNLSVVIAKYKEDISFVKGIEFDTFVYDKSGETPDYLADIRTAYNINYSNLPNIGREDFTYLYHIYKIVSTKNNEYTHTCFLQGKPFDHCENLLNVLKRDLDGNVVWLNLYQNQSFLTTGRKGDQYHNLNTGYFLDILFKDAPESWLFNPGAQFIVPNDLLEFRSLKFWKVCLSLVSYPEAAYIFERIWPLIFDKKIESKW
jgi:hypothetical protein